MINLGIYTQSFGGALSGGVSFLFRFDGTWVAACNTATGANAYETMGLCLGQFLKQLLNAESPAYNYDDTSLPFSQY